MLFQLTIHTKTHSFGDREDQERAAIVHALQFAAHEIGRGGPLIGVLKDWGTAEPCGTFAYGPDALNKSLDG
jgi:hypothetical protein